MKRIVKGDLLRRIKLNRKRLSARDYRYPLVFQQNDAWPGDWQGRCILALTSLYFALSGYPFSQRSLKRQLDKIVDHLPDHLNRDGYFGKIVSDEYVNEQQVSGNSWYLRGIIEYYQITHSEKALKMVRDVVDHFIAKIASFYSHYPLTPRHDGGVDGHEEDHIESGWMMSSDIGCAFIMLDAMSEAYYLLRDESLKEIVAKVIKAFKSIDFLGLRCQTHATLSCARGILTYYRATGEKEYLDFAKKVFDTYLEYGITADYSNVNWFGRPETWTEPCCIVDSFLLASQLYEDTGDERYVPLMNRIYLNAFRLAQRGNGGAGCNTCLVGENKTLKAFLYEAYFCCTMRFAEGLRFAKKYSANFKDGTLEILLPIEGSFSLHDGAKVTIRGDLYRDKTMVLKCKKVKKPFTINLYIPSTLCVRSDEWTGERSGNWLRIPVCKDTEIRLDATLKIHEENGLKFIGDRLLMERVANYGDEPFDYLGKTYYYVLDYSLVTKESEAMEIIETL